MRTKLMLMTVLILLCTGTSLRAQEDVTSRAFYLGFTPFPYEISLDAVLDVYERIGTDADMIVHHFDNGIPWEEALSGGDYSANIMDDWSLRRDLSPSDHQVTVTMTPISIGRDALAPYRGEQDDMPLPAPWDSYSFDHPDVITAYINHAFRTIDYFAPDYFLFGIEVNLLMNLRPDLWDAYMTLHRETYAALKADYPDLTVMVSLTGIDLLEGYTDVNHNDQMQALADIIDHTDIVALSMYPFMTVHLTNTIPSDMFSRLAQMIDKPLAIAETGYPAQAFRVGMGVNIDFNGTPELQAEYIALLLESAQTYDFAFVTNFILRDYDALWEMMGAQEDITILWRDTGLYDENGDARPALDIWRAWLARPMSAD